MPPTLPLDVEGSNDGGGIAAAAKRSDESQDMRANDHPTHLKQQLRALCRRKDSAIRNLQDQLRTREAKIKELQASIA
jgi:hypothetical protein